MQSQAGSLSSERLLVANIIVGLGLGGAEVALQRLVTRLDPTRFQPVVISLTGRGTIGPRLERAGVRVIALGSEHASTARIIPRLVTALREIQPSIVQTWMYHADLFGGIAARLSGRPPVVWGIRSALRHPREAGKMTQHVIKACALASRRLPDRIVSVSETGRQIHASWGYPLEKIDVIANGFDLDEFQPSQSARAAFREELGVPSDVCLVTNVGRVHPHKDHGTLFRSVERLVTSGTNVHLVVGGEGADTTNKDLRALVPAEIKERVHLLGARDDISRILSGSDIYCSSSIAEAFPNSVGEAMSCQVPCVVTNIGDSAQLVGDTGVIAPAKDPNAIAAGLASLVAAGPEGRQELGRKARQRIAENYDVKEIVQRYQSLYLELAT